MVGNGFGGFVRGTVEGCLAVIGHRPHSGPLPPARTGTSNTPAPTGRLQNRRRVIAHENTKLWMGASHLDVGEGLYQLRRRKRVEHERYTGKTTFRKEEINTATSVRLTPTAISPCSFRTRHPHGR